MNKNFKRTCDEEAGFSDPADHHETAGETEEVPGCPAVMPAFLNTHVVQLPCRGADCIH